MMMLLTTSENKTKNSVIERLYEEHKINLFHMANEILKNETEAEDAVHECFLKITQKSKKYSRKPYAELTRISNTIVRNEAFNIWRERQKVAPLAENDLSTEEYMLDTVPDVLSQLIQKYDGRQITQALMKLSQNEREFLCLQYGYGFMPKDIASIFGMTPAAVRKEMYNCRNRLAKILKSKEFEDLHPNR